MSTVLGRVNRVLAGTLMAGVLLLGDCHPGEPAPPGADALARRLYQVAQEGRAEAQYGVSVLYQTGHHGFPHDPDQALLWMQRAAAQGYAYAEVDLGYHLLDPGPAHDPVKGRHWLTAAARQGNANAEYGLARLYVTGQNATPDLVKAYAWSRLAQDDGLGMAGEIVRYAVSGLSLNQFARASRLYRRLQHARRR